ncbi:MAG: hypothetical protein EZS28_011268 [Streblomastix strix]|uniref:Uncharacterized protein n=1 Tax=Streblomastix strix TaxID=222440 RepID=A0A5J4WEP8_9EUKA|nr:MAG: hypothetical protein EZS28_011268 [Streblomastix strix]
MHVLNNSRCADGSEFTLLGQLHVENLFFFEDVSVLIKDGATQSGNSIRTTLQVNDTQSYLIYIVNGRSTLQNLEFNFTKLANGTAIPIGDALYQTCTGGYRITMASQVHVEFVNVSKPQTAPVLIKGGAISGGREIRTTMTFNSYQPHTVFLDQGNLTLQNLEFNFTLLSNQSIYPDLSLVGTSNSTSASYGAEFIIESSKFVNIKNYHIYGSGISLQFGGQNQKIAINKCTIENISCNVTEKQFINCIDNHAGAFTAIIVSDKLFFQNNSFSGNKLIRSDQRGQDAFLWWRSEPTGWNYSNTLTKIQSLIKGSISTDINSINYSTPSVQGFISLPKEQLEYCKSKAELSQVCECDPNSTKYPLATCERDKKGEFDLASQTNATYPCLSTGDPRAGIGQCPAYCISKDSQTANCICDSNSSTYPTSNCEKDKLCITDLANQPNSSCPCINTADPRAGFACPQYCKSKNELTSECICEYRSIDYPQTICEKDKLCIIDLIHQSLDDCPCLSTGDPRTDTICKQAEQQDDVIKKEDDEQEDENQQEKDKSSSFNMIYIIIVAAGGTKKQVEIN